MSAGAEVVGAFGGLEDVDELADEVPEAADGALACFSQHGFEAGEGLFDGVEVWAVGREEEQGCAGGFDPLAHGGPFVAGEIVHDDDIAGPEFGHQDLGDIGLEPVAVDGAIEHHGRYHPAGAQARDQRGGLAVAVGKAHPQPLAAPCATMAAGHVGRGPSLIDEQQPVWVKVELAVEPGLALPQDVGAVLLDGVASLFYA